MSFARELHSVGPQNDRLDDRAAAVVLRLICAAKETKLDTSDGDLDNSLQIGENAAYEAEGLLAFYHSHIERSPDVFGLRKHADREFAPTANG